MDISRVAVFGHRIVVDSTCVDRVLEGVLIDIIEQNEYVEFYIGRNGAFDILTASILHRIRKKIGGSNFSVILVLPYFTAEYKNNADSFHSYYTDIEILFDERTHPKSAIGKRNRYMVENADLILCNIIEKYGGAWNAVKYAQRQEIPIVNIADIIHCENMIEE